MKPHEVFNNYVERSKYKDVKSLLEKADEELRDLERLDKLKNYSTDELKLELLIREGKAE